MKQRVKKLERRNKVRVLKLRRLQKVGTTQRVETSDETVIDDVSNQGRMIAEMDQDADVVLEEAKEVTEDAKVDESVDIQGRQADETITAASTTIIAVEAQVPAATLTASAARVTATPKDPKPFKKKQQIEQDEKYARELQAELNKNIDCDEAIDHVKKKAKEDPAAKRYQVLKRKPQTKAQARKNMMVYLKNVAGFKMDYFKGILYDDIRPIFEARFNSNRAAKRQKLDEEVEELKRHLQIVPNEYDDVYTEATPLARKVLVVDYQIIDLNNKPYYKIIRADDTSQFKGQRMEAIGIMWCANHNVYNHTADFVSREEVPTHKIHLDQMLNVVRLEVEEESGVSLELLRFIRQQHQEGQLE
nr:hypothetical protein [Tanacetum cinerariifolium]